MRGRSLPLWMLSTMLGFPELGLAAGRDSVAAEALFREGRAAVARGDFEEGCRKLEAAARLERTAGALLNVAACAEHDGRNATAWERYRSAWELMEESDPRRSLVEKRLAALEPLLPRVVLQVADACPNDAEITRDGVAYSMEVLGIPIPLDPGRHLFVVRAAGYEDRRFAVEAEAGVTKPLVLEPGPKLSRVEPRVVEPAVSIPLHPPPRPAAAAKPESTHPAPGDAGSLRTEPGRWLLWTSGAIAAAGFVTWGVSGALLLDRKAKVDQGCDADACTDEARRAAQQGHTLDALATTSLLVGLAGAGTTLGLWLYSKDAKSSSTPKHHVTVSLAGTQLLVQAKFQ